MKALNIYKIGGDVIDKKEKLQEFLGAFSHAKGLKILVHGGGKIATSIADLLLIKTKMIEGRRITNDEMIDVVTMTYGGLINKKMVSYLQAKGVNALGLSGADGDLILAEKRPIQNGIDFGWVGDPKHVNRDFLIALIEKEMIPVIAPLTHDGNGNMLNTNADTIANILAVEMVDCFEVSLNYCFELKGVMKDVEDPNSLIKELTMESYQKYKESGVISSGMIPKLDNAFEAIKNGVKSVRIIDYRSISNLEKDSFNEFTIIH